MASAAAPPASRRSCFAMPARRVVEFALAAGVDLLLLWHFALWQRRGGELNGPRVVVYPLRNHGYDSPFSAQRLKKSVSVS
eukprot:5180897-Pleurochrysis_carterae.AAC.3